MSDTPFSRQTGCRISDALCHCGLRIIVLENELLRVAILPEKGGEIYSLQYKPKDIDPLLHYRPWQIPSISSWIRRLFFSPSGTSLLIMRCARPSTMAILPTPGSPISAGLFLVRRERISMVRRISSSRPMTGSSLPWRANAVRSRPYFSSA
jgi:hypothetical protein